jgi:diguanylate cyclase (GGDEF)-like protein
METSILTIDDSLPIHQLMRSMFASLGVATHAAYDGKRGLTMAAHYRPNLILLDVDMPEMDGFEVCQRLKSSKETSPIPVIFLTADYAKADQAKGFALGAAAYIVKPFVSEQLMETVLSSLQAPAPEVKPTFDRVTGLRNRGFLEEHVKSQTQAARQTGAMLSCITCDVDELRIVNSRHGQTAGDEVLRALAQMLTSQCRPEDVVCNSGGGRFSIVAPGIDRGDAGRTARRISEQVRNLQVMEQDKKIAVSCTFGVADLEIAGHEPLLDRAEAALRRAKLNGKGSVSVARPERG